MFADASYGSLRNIVNGFAISVVRVRFFSYPYNFFVIKLHKKKG